MARISKPVLIIGAPRSGSTLLYHLLAEIPELWSIGGESREIIERHHHPRVNGWESGRLEADDLTPASAAYIVRAFAVRGASGHFWRRVNGLRAWLRRRRPWQRIKARGRSRSLGGGLASQVPGSGLATIQRLVRMGNAVSRLPSAIRLLEKTPENCLRLPFLLELFPDASIIHLIRDGRANVSSLIEAWRQPHLFPGYRVPGGVEIAGDTRGRWAFTLIPGWRQLRTAALEEVCAWQWVRCNEAVLDFRGAAGARVPWLELRLEELVAEPILQVTRLASFLEVDPDSLPARARDHLPEINVVSLPAADKWQRHSAEIARVDAIIAPMMERLGYRAS